jgi:hypothetical protein
VLGHTANNFIENVALNHESRTGTATLAMIKKDGVGCAGNRGIEVTDIFENDVGRFSAKFETDLLQVSGGRADNDLAHFG